jgi:hypothetical protein
MNENETTSVEPVKNNNVQDTNISQPVQEQPIESQNEINWKKFREEREIERKRAAELAQVAKQKEAEAEALKMALESVLNKQQPNYQQQQQNDDYYEESDEQKIEKKVNELLARREQEAERKRQEEEAISFPTKLKNVHADFDQVCSSSNLDYLEYHHPELAKSLGRLPQSFEKWNDIYNAIKRYVPNLDSRKEIAKAEANFNKPQSISSPGLTQSGNAMPSQKLDDKRKAENYARMQKVIRGLS